jgi:hypothetical protein
LTLLAGVAGLVFVLAALRLPGRDLPIAAMLAGGAAAAIAAVYVGHVRTASARVLARLLEGRGTLDPAAVGTRYLARPGAGVWVVLAGGVALVVAGLVVLLRDRESARVTVE